jgi:UPF0755 protein
MTNSSPSTQPRARRRRIAAVVAVTLVATLVLAAAAATFLFVAQLERPFWAGAAGERFVEVPPGASVSAIAGRLVEAGIVRDRWVFRLAVHLRDAERALKAGEYRFDRPATPFEVVDRLARGDVFLRPITFPEGLTLSEMAEVYAERGLGDAAEFIRAATAQAALVHDLDAEARDLEGYLFPETYTLPRSAGADGLVAMMVARFRAVLGEAQRAAPPGTGRSVRHVVTLASLVEKETAVAEERPVVAGVYANRLRIGMGLQCDPTVIYALQKAGRWTGNLRRDDLRIDSPYNTYRYAGLPPGPIANPGRAAIEAALAPAAVPYLYFVSRNDGSHMFARDLAQHNRNVRAFQVEYFRRRAGKD